MNSLIKILNIQHKFKRSIHTVDRLIDFREYPNKERSLNYVQLLGRVGQDPRIGKIESDENGTKIERKIITFALATNEFTGQTDTGEVNYRTDWHRITVFQPRIQEVIEKFVRRGDRILATGRLNYNPVKDKLGEYRFVSGIILQDVMLLKSKSF